ncbi:MAG: 5'-nucleotidase C-terminal domain-containing protein [Peptoniphilaceae bacterium]|nr:5'-nucleotidase C-terminal domain-containing protein [Peptoniphilaceae bacterium]
MKKRTRLVLAIALSVGLIFPHAAYAESGEATPLATFVENVRETEAAVTEESEVTEADLVVEADEETTEAAVAPQEKEAALAVANEAVANKEITILHTNDVHGNVEAEANEDGETGKIGYAKYAGVIEKTKADGPTLVLDMGDATQGTNFVTLSQGESMIELMNKAGVQFFVPGNHEFDYSKEQALKLHEMSDFPWLASNVFDENGNLVFDEGQLVDVDGVKLGIFGMATPETKYKANPNNTKGLNFTETLDETVKIAQGEIDRLLSRGANYTIMMSHLGSDKASEINTLKVVEQLKNLDLMLDGHSHTVWTDGHVFENGTLGASTGSALENIGVVTIAFNDKGEATTTARLMNFKEAQDYDDNEDIKATIEAFNKDNEKVLGQVVGTLSETLDGVREHVRAGETAMGDLITDAMLKESGADVVITNGGGIRASIDAGEVTVGDVFTVLPFGNAMTVIEVTGQDIIDALNFGVSDYPEPAGKFPHVAGMTFEIVKGEGETPSTATNIKINGQAVDPSKTYKLATNDFMAVGGDGYTMFENHKLLATHGSLAQVVEDYMTSLTKENNGTFTYKADGRVTEAVAMNVPLTPPTKDPQQDPTQVEPQQEEPGKKPAEQHEKPQNVAPKKDDTKKSSAPKTGDMAMAAPLFLVAAGSALYLLKKKEEMTK